MRGTLSKRVLRQVDGLLAAWPDHPARFWARCARVTHWDSLLSCVSQHGVLEILRPGLLDERSPLTATHRSWINRTCTLERWMQHPILETLTIVLAALESAAVRAVALKGPILSERLLGEPSARRFSDLDFLVTPEDLGRATQALQSLGYGHHQSPSEAFFRAHHHHIHLHAPGRPVLELHFILSSNFGVSVPGTPFLERATPFASKHGPTWVLTPEDEFLYLAQHAAGHAFARAAWLYDLKMLWLRYPGMDAEEISRRATEVGMAQPLGFALHVLKRRLDMVMTENSCRGGVRHWFGDRLLELIDVLPPDGLPRKLAGWVYEGALADRIEMQSALFRRRLAAWRDWKGRAD